MLLRIIVYFIGYSNFILFHLDLTQLPNGKILYRKLNEFTIQKNNLLTTLSLLGKQYSVSFQVFQSNWVSGNARSVIHLTLGGNGWPSGVYGDRTPAVWLYPNGKFHIASAVGGNRNYVYNSASYQAKLWITVRISQLLSDSIYRYRIFINNETVHDVINTKPVEFKNIKVYAGDPFSEPQPGSIRNLIIEGKDPSFTHKLLTDYIQSNLQTETTNKYHIAPTIFKISLYKAFHWLIIISSTI